MELLEFYHDGDTGLRTRCSRRYAEKSTTIQMQPGGPAPEQVGYIVEPTPRHGE
jgi:hypothetical protein